MRTEGERISASVRVGPRALSQYTSLARPKKQNHQHYVLQPAPGDIALLMRLKGTNWASCEGQDYAAIKVKWTLNPGDHSKTLTSYQSAQISGMGVCRQLDARGLSSGKIS